LVLLYSNSLNKVNNKNIKYLKAILLIDQSLFIEIK